MAREQYLLHAGEETIHSEKLKKTPQTPKEKRENFWYYHKWHVLIAIVAAIVVITCVVEKLNSPDADYRVGLVTEYQVSQETIDNLETKLEKYAKDRNGDGKVVVSVVTYSIGTGQANAQMLQVSETKLAGDYSDNSVMMFLCDSAGYSFLEKQDGLAADSKKLALPAILQQKGYALTANMRVLYPDSDKQYDQHKAYWDASKALYTAAEKAK